ncbi:hypothetical protein J6590_038540 [Homalodisca vitripennis]|nr:hypothetical protein J6590_038540 [Homalodisca vitripennis]
MLELRSCSMGEQYETSKMTGFTGSSIHPDEITVTYNAPQTVASHALHDVSRHIFHTYPTEDTSIQPQK